MIFTNPIRVKYLKHSIILLSVVLLSILNSNAQELVINGGAEVAFSTEWIEKTPGDNWDISNQRDPHSGNFHFYPKTTVNASSELYQNIPVDGNAASIDAGKAFYLFSGWRRGFRNSAPFSNDQDRSQIIVEYRDALDNVLSTFDTGSAVFTTWTNDIDNRFAPIGTRTIRIRLISVRVTSRDNDGYYDDISLTTCTTPPSVIISPNATSHICLGSSLEISGLPFPSNSNYNYTWDKDGSAITSTSNILSSYIIATTGLADAGVYTLTVQDAISNNPACASTTSVSILVDPIPIAGTITNNQEICINTTPNSLTGTSSTGGFSTKFYKWQQSTSISGPWTTAQIFNTSSTGYSPNELGNTTYFRRIDSSGICYGAPTNTIKIQINTKAIINSITPLLRDTLCVGENFQLTANVNTATQPSLNGGYHYYWRKMQGNSSTIVTTPSNTLVSYPINIQTATVQDSGTYYLVVQDGPTAKACKDSLKIIIRINQSATIKAIIQNDQEICLNEPTIPIFESNPGAGMVGGPISYQWFTSQDTTNAPVLTKISSSNNKNYNPGLLTSTKYYLRKDSVKYCPTVQTNFLKIRVNNKPILDSIRATVNDTLCVNNADQFQLKGYVDSLTAGKQPINGGFYFTWKKLQEPAVTSEIISPTEAYYDYPKISRPVTERDSGTYYLVVQDGIDAKNCLDFMLIKIHVEKTCILLACNAPNIVSIKLSTPGNSTLCEGNTLSLKKDVITLPSPPSIYGYEYSWIRTNTLGTFTVQGPTSTYEDLKVNSVALIDSGRYQLVVKDKTLYPSNCLEKSAPISIKINSAITSAKIGSDTTVCIGNITSMFTESVSNTGGTGSYTHQWQSSTDNILFEDITNATNINYQASILLNKTFFKRIDKSGSCIPSSSNTISVLTTTGVVAGIIESKNPTICYNSIPTKTLINLLGASGGSGGNTSTKYQWQKSFDGSTWQNILGAIDTDFNETTTLRDTTYYRRKVSMGFGNCDTNYTNTIQINVYALNSPGKISKDTNVCAGHIVKLLTELDATGEINSYQWILSVNKGLSWINAPGDASLKDYTTLGLSDTTWFKRIIKTPCGNDTSNLVQIGVIPLPQVSAGNDTTVLKNSLLVLNGNVQGSTNYVWTPSTHLSDPFNLNPEARITSAITYTLRAFDPTNKCFSEDVVHVRIKAPLNIPNVITPNGDGVNDTWKIEDINQYPKTSFVIYNRWGNIVYKSASNAFEWNGTNYRNGEDLPEGTYFYIIDLKRIEHDEPLTGYIQIVR